MKLHYQPRQSRHVDIAASREVRAALELAVRRRCVVRITGHSGTGKTFALKHHGSDFHAEYFECTGYLKNTRGVFIMLYGEGGLRLQTHKLVEAVEGRLESRAWHNSQCPLILDEWQNLELPAQREVLRLADRFEVPMVLACNHKSLFSGRRQTDALEQINSRVVAEFSTLPLSAADALSIAIDRNVEGAEARRTVALLATKLDFRQLNNFLDEAAAATGGAGSIRIEHLKMAVMVLAGSAKAVDLLRKPASEEETQ